MSIILNSTENPRIYKCREIKNKAKVEYFIKVNPEIETDNADYLMAMVVMKVEMMARQNFKTPPSRNPFHLPVFLN